MNQLNKLNEPNKLKELTASFLFYLSILFFIIGFNFSDNRAGGWTQQFMPFINNRPISDITFLDSLTGYAVTEFAANDTSYILKTTNGGDNWNIIFKEPSNLTNVFSRVQFLNINTGYVCGSELKKTINAGINWSTVNTSGIYAKNMHVLNEDTIWLVDENSLVGGVFFTSNGGANWTQQLLAGASNPDRIYMFNERFGFANRNGGNFMYRTTNSGINWTVVPGIDGFRDIYFADTLVGWKCSVSGGYMKKTTNGGLNWVTQILPSGGIIQTSGISSFSNINKDTIWANGGYVLYPNNQVRIYLLRTTNEGANWLMQIPDTSINMSYYYVNFTNRLNGWATDLLPQEIHTITGGGDTFYTSVKQININEPYEFHLEQNFPNPFNPKTNIKYQILKSSYVKLKVFDIQGKELETPVNQKQNAGTYEVTFDGSKYSSGIYFYSFYADGVLVDTKKMILIK